MANGMTLPPQYQADQQSIERRRKMAQMLAQQALTPQQGQMAGRIYVPPGPLSAISRIAQAYFGGQGMKRADEDESKLGQQYQSGLAEEVQRISAMRQGQPATTDAADNIEDPGKPGDPRAAVTAALTSQYGPVREMGKLDYQGDLRSQEAARERAGRMELKAMELEARSEDRALDRAARAQAAKEANALRLQIAQLTKAAGGRSPYFQFLPTSTGYAAGNTRTGDVEPVIGKDGKPVVRATDSPALQGDIAGARERGKAEATRAFNMSGIGQTIASAEKLLQGIDPETGLGTDKPTGSGMGTIVDSAAGFFGFSPSGAPEADKLRAAGAALTSKMPRMEGPQSDRDVQLYREAAGQVGDSTIPRERRLAAIKVVRDLWAKYEHLNQGEFGGGSQGGGANPQPAAGVPEGVPPEVWNAMTPQERALWQ